MSDETTANVRDDADRRRAQPVPRRVGDPEGARAPSTTPRARSSCGRSSSRASPDIEGFSHLFVLWVFDRSEGYELVAAVPLDPETPHGVFASRSPRRPNPIGALGRRAARPRGAAAARARRGHARRHAHPRHQAVPVGRRRRRSCAVAGWTRPRSGERAGPETAAAAQATWCGRRPAWPRLRGPSRCAARGSSRTSPTRSRGRCAASGRAARTAGAAAGAASGGCRTARSGSSGAPRGSSSRRTGSPRAGSAP